MQVYSLRLKSARGRCCHPLELRLSHPLRRGFRRFDWENDHKFGPFFHPKRSFSQIAFSFSLSRAARGVGVERGKSPKKGLRRA